MNPVLIAC